jgi:hypothetical protein
MLGQLLIIWLFKKFCPPETEEDRSKLKALKAHESHNYLLAFGTCAAAVAFFFLLDVIPWKDLWEWFIPFTPVLLLLLEGLAALVFLFCAAYAITKGIKKGSSS